MKRAAAAMIFALMAAACSSNIDTPEAVKRGVINDLSKRMDVQNMDVNVDSVSFRDREADAVVSFAPKGMPASQGMTMRYKLQRSGNEWHIASRSSGDLKRHEGQQGGAESQAGQLPPGHPAIGNGVNEGNLPAGHSSVPSGEAR